MKPKVIKFALYRYQLVPLTKHIQAKMFDSMFTSYADLVEKKNKFFFDILRSVDLRFHEDSEKIGHMIEYSDSTSLILKMNVRKKTILETKDFRVKAEDDYPKAMIFINNNKDHQIIAIQTNSKAFSNTDVTARIIEKSLAPYLAKYNLGFYVEAIFDKIDFWKVLKKNANKISYLKFELIKPNISNISAKIKESFDMIGSDTNSHRTVVELHAPDGKTLENLTPDNQSLNALTEYSLNGGGKQPVYRIGRIQKTHKTVFSEKTIDITDISLMGTHQSISKMFKRLTKL